MISIPPQSKLMRKYPYLDRYNDVKNYRDPLQTASNLVRKTMTFAELCFQEVKGLNTQKCSSQLLLDDGWPTMAEFNVFTALPKIDAFMKNKYLWLSHWPHSMRHLKEIVISNHLSFHVFEICYGAARVSYPVTQATFSVYFVFEINLLEDQGSECIVKYFLEGWDEELIPYVKDKITKPRVKALLKKKLALSSAFNFESNSKQVDIKNLIHEKKLMLENFKFGANVTMPFQTIPFPYNAHIRKSKKCPVHGKNCTLFCVSKKSAETHDEEEALSHSFSSSSSSSLEKDSNKEKVVDPKICLINYIKANRQSRSVSSQGFHDIACADSYPDDIDNNGILFNIMDE